MGNLSNQITTLYVDNQFNQSCFIFYQIGEIPSLDEHLQSLFKVVHIGPLATGIQSLMLLYQVMESHQAVSGRYYQALYAKMLDPQLKHSGKQVSTGFIDKRCCVQ